MKISAGTAYFDRLTVILTGQANRELGGEGIVRQSCIKLHYTMAVGSSCRGRRGTGELVHILSIQIQKMKHRISLKQVKIEDSLLDLATGFHIQRHTGGEVYKDKKFISKKIITRYNDPFKTHTHFNFLVKCKDAKGGTYYKLNEYICKDAKEGYGND